MPWGPLACGHSLWTKGDLMKSRFALIASCVSLLATGSCTSSNPTQTDLAVSSDMSVATDDMASSTPPDMASLPPDMVPGCGFGQALDTGGAGTCSCDTKHTSMCASTTYCCGAAQSCLSAAGPRGETRCSGPPAREDAAMGYDPLRNNIILRTGGCLDAGQNPILCTDQWTLGQVTWDVQTPTTAITPRKGSIMAWLPTKGTLLLFGGQTDANSVGTAVNDLYSWSGTDWTKLTQAVSPSARTFSAMAYDSDRSVMVLFGGDDKTDNDQSDTWEYNGNTAVWKQNTMIVTEPLEREGHGIVYDTKIKKIVMHAGLVKSKFDRDTWTYDGNDWTKLTDNPAVPVHGYFAMVYDPVRKVTVLYGGETTNNVPVGDTWEFDGTTSTWTLKSTAGPAKRTKPSMVYDQGRKAMVVFGGNNAGLQKDAWTWDGTTWNQIY